MRCEVAYAGYVFYVGFLSSGEVRGGRVFTG